MWISSWTKVLISLFEFDEIISRVYRSDGSWRSFTGIKELLALPNFTKKIGQKSHAGVKDKKFEHIVEL